MNFLSKNESDSLLSWLIELKEFQLDNMFDTNVLGRAYLYIDSIVEVKNEKNHLSHKIEGTASYTTELIHQEGNIYGTCTCPYEGNCKHLAASILSYVSNEYRT